MPLCAVSLQGRFGLALDMAKCSQLYLLACCVLQDIAHTFPNHRWLHEADGQAALRRVLAAYSVHNEEVGYCRPMVHIVALLLVALNR